MSFTQIECGSSAPFFDLPADMWAPLVTPTWISHLWEECNSKNISIKFYHEFFWVPKPVRDHDTCIMDIAHRMHSGQQLMQLNMCRLALQVTFVSNIASVDGQRILLAYYNGKAHEESGRRTRLNWPPIGELPAQWWKLWQEFLTGWCGTALKLPKPLGWWYEGGEMLTQCCFFQHEHCLLMQHKEDFYEFAPLGPRARTRFQLSAFPLHDTSILKQAKVVDITYKHRCIYVISQSTQNIISQSSADPPRHFQDLYRDLSPELQRLIGSVTWPAPHELVSIGKAVQDGTALGVSDGSLRATVNKATQAWVIQAKDGSEIKGMGPVDGDVRMCTIHRAELQGQTALL